MGSFDLRCENGIIFYYVVSLLINYVILLKLNPYYLPFLIAINIYINIFIFLFLLQLCVLYVYYFDGKQIPQTLSRLYE